MVLNVNRLSNNSNIYANYQGKKSDNSPAMANASESFNGNKDKSKDGKFSFSEAMKNFSKGVLSPVTNMFSSPQNFIVGVGMIVGSMALIAATGGAAAPILVAAGVGMGAIQAGKAVYNIATAKDGDDVEKAFYDVGGATSAIGLSVVGAKCSLKQANIETEGLNALNAVKKCFTSAKDLTVESINVFKSGYYKTNLDISSKMITQPTKLRKYSRELYEEGKQHIDDATKSLREILPDELKPALKGRNKCEISIYEKIVKERTVEINRKISQVQDNPILSEAVKKDKIASLLEERKKIDTDANFAKSKIEDLYGIRITGNINQLVAALVDAVKRGDIEITEIENYRGFNPIYNKQNEFYFSEAQIAELCEASKVAKTNVKVKVKNASKPSGYTATQLKIKQKNGKVIELQIRGEEIDKVSNWEHIPYDLRQGKDIAKGNNQLGILLSKAQKVIKELSTEQYAKYQEYIYDNYIYAQAKEFGKITTNPSLPEGIDPILSSENLRALHKQTLGFKPGNFKNPFNVSAQLALVAGEESLLKD